MRIAVTVENDNGLQSEVSQHFGRSPFFAFVDLEGDKLASFEILANPFADGHLHGQIPTFIHESKADVIISGGMGRGAYNFFQQFGITTRTGAAGTLEQALKSYLMGELGEEVGCGHHGHGHGEHHGHGHGGCQHD